MSNLLSAQQGLLTAATYQAAAFSAINADFYVDGTYGFDGNPGTSPGLAFRTFLPLSYQLPLWRKNNNYNQQIVVAFSGVVQQEWSTPFVNDVVILGASGGSPRQATTSGVPNGGGATWLSPSSGTGCLLTVNGQSWRIASVYFNNSATAAPGIRFDNVGDPPTQSDGAWSVLEHCTITGTDDGVSLRGGGGIVIQNNRFLNFSTSGAKALITEAGAGGGTGAWARVLNNDFQANLTHIDAVAHSWEIAFNHFSYINAGVTTTLQVDLAGGSNNSVHHNYFDLPHNTNGISAMFAGGTNDRWYWNYFSTAVTTTIAAFSVPAS